MRASPPITGEKRWRRGSSRNPRSPTFLGPEELNLDNLALLGRPSFQSFRALARNFPYLDFQVYVPSIQAKKKLKNGSISVKSKPLFPGCVFLRCVLNMDIHDFRQESDGVGGFVGSKRQINKPRPVDAEDMEAISKQSKKEQDKADQTFLEEYQGHEPLDFEKLNLDSNPASLVRQFGFCRGPLQDFLASLKSLIRGKLWYVNFLEILI
ncbi:hypothetical protein ACH5RR_004932 [Cinchona calisaya]|uniref:NusG-like N-terminal domain-containing protein n=1 Tax=Cinchona calisaya TaxID=153742 RepID=A0ABD3AZ54_9GENT